jgi:hypothetical protein
MATHWTTAIMNQAITDEFLAALRAAQRLAGAPLTAMQVEALGEGLGLPHEALPALLAGLQREGAVALVYRGGVEALPEKSSAASGPVFNIGPNSVVQAPLHGDAIMGDVHVSPDRTIGDLVAALARLRELQSTLTGEATEVAQAAESTLAKAASREAPVSERPGLVRRALQSLKELLAYAPQVKGVVDIVQAVSGFLG